jgi:nucleotide-binding universal stress UspA family protein
MKKILLPTDFSANAWNATRYAIELYRKKPCTFYLLNTYTPAIVHSRFMAATVQGGIYEDNVKTLSENGLRDMVEQIEAECKYEHHKFETISSFSLLTEEIKDLIDTANIDLIVTGTKGASGFEEVFMGSNTVRIIKAVRKCPVLVVPENYQYKKLRRVAFATDFKRNFSLDVIKPLTSLAQNLKAAVHVVHINESEALDKYQQSNKDMLTDFLEPLEHHIHWMPYFSGKSDVMQYFLEEFKMDILALVHYKHGLLEELIREPVIKRVAFHTQIPLLVMPE